MFGVTEKWMKLADVQFISKTTFYAYQRKFVLPQIRAHCERSLMQTREEIIARSKLHPNKNIHNCYIYVIILCAKMF